MKDKLYEKAIDFIDRLISEHLYDVILAIISGILVLLFFPDDNWVILKLGKTTLFVLAFCVTFLLVGLGKNVLNKIKMEINRIIATNYQNESQVKENNKAIEKFNEFVDSLDFRDKEILVSFVKNGNKTLVAPEQRYFNGYSLLGDRQIILATDFNGNIRSFDKTQYWITTDLGSDIQKGYYPAGQLKQYKLKIDFYMLIKSIYDETGKFGNF